MHHFSLTAISYGESLTTTDPLLPVLLAMLKNGRSQKVHGPRIWPVDELDDLSPPPGHGRDLFLTSGRHDNRPFALELVLNHGRVSVGNSLNVGSVIPASSMDFLILSANLSEMQTNNTLEPEEAGYADNGLHIGVQGDPKDVFGSLREGPAHFVEVEESGDDHIGAGHCISGLSTPPKRSSIRTGRTFTPVPSSAPC